MKFLKVQLENLFAYEEAEFDFSDTTEDRRVALVWGRNGMGKTSFLRALKLLFLGIEPKSVRTVGVPSRTLPHRQYIVGDGAGWSGLLNQRAIARAAAEGREPSGMVSATWLLDDGGRMRVERRWTASSFGYAESLTVFDASGRLASEAAQDRLDELMPADFVDFFFFDGEDIKELAESDERKTLDFDRLLRLTFLGDIVNELRILTRERNRSGLGDQMAERLAESEAALARATRTASTAREELRHTDEILTTDGAQLRRLHNTREGLGSVASDSQRETLEVAIADLGRELGEQQEQVARTIPPSVPMVANIAMVRAALEEVERKLASGSPAERAFVARTVPKLTGWINDSRITLPAESATELAGELARRLEAELPTATPAGMFSNVDELRADRLRESLLRWSVAGPDLARAHTQALSNVRRLDREIREAREALMRLEVGSQVNLERYREIVAEIAKIDERIADANQRKGQLQGRVTDADAEAGRLRTSIAAMQQDQDRLLRERAEARQLARLATTLNELRDELRHRTREIVRDRINVRFRELVHTHPVIARIEIDENYTMNFLATDGGFIGRSSLSSGIKQLAATALLWAMKDVASLDMPVVVDTPLARIDRENQDNMLENYYPKLAGQVIVLPTNAELDRDKFELIKSHVGVQLKIRNEDGDRATVARGSLMEG